MLGPVRDRARSRYLLYVGGLSPHKNLLRLIEAFARAAPDRRPPGPGGRPRRRLPHPRPGAARGRRRGRAGRARPASRGSSPTPTWLTSYSRAYALVQPSLMEGFGLPPVEAMACGTPVLCSAAGSLPEVVGDAGLFFDPTDVAAIAGAIAAFLADPAARDPGRAGAAPGGGLLLGRLGPDAAGLLRRAGPDRPERRPPSRRDRRETRTFGPNQIRVASVLTFVHRGPALRIPESREGGVRRGAFGCYTCFVRSVMIRFPPLRLEAETSPRELPDTLVCLRCLLLPTGCGRHGPLGADIGRHGCRVR